MAELVNKLSSETPENYFISYEDVEIHRLMVSDKPRTEAFRDAILKNKHLFCGKVAMDVGAGTGILSLFMAEAGARKVYAIEASNLADLIPQVAKANGYEDIIVSIHSKVEEVQLPKDEKVDIIVSEWMGFYLFHESMLSSVLNARDRFLADDGSIFPSAAKLFACPCSLENLYKDQLYFWDNVYGFNMAAIKNYVHKTKCIKPDIYNLKSSDLLSDPVCIKSINLRYISLEEVKSFTTTSFVGITKAGHLQGLALWFDCEFDGRDYDEKGEEYGSLEKLSTSPFTTRTHWKQTVIAFGVPNDNTSPKFGNENWVSEDEVIGWKLELTQSSDNIRYYTISLEICDPDETEHSIPCICPMPRCRIIAKMIETEDNCIENCEDL